MKILVNCSTLKKGGVLQVAHSFITELLKRNDHEYYIVLSTSLKRSFPNLSPDSRISIYDIVPSVFLSLTGNERYLNTLVKNIKPDIVFTLFSPSYWKPKCTHVCGFAKPRYIYPDSPYFKTLSRFHLAKLMVMKLLHMHDISKFNCALITETEDASDRLIKILPNKNIYTVSNTYNQVYDKPDIWEKGIILPEFKGITLLTVSANYKHKNLTILTQVVNYLRKLDPDFSFRFVLTLDENDFPITDNEVRKHIVLLGAVSIYQCPYLYELADLMIMPTLVECFTATYPEAMKMGVPVLTSDLSFARSICGDAAMYFDPMSPKSIGDAIYKISKNPYLRKDYIEKGRKRLLSFETGISRANKYIEILEKEYEANHSKS